jgi:hypothetical protein
MKFMMIAAAALCVAFAGCNQEKTQAPKADAKPAVEAAKKAADATAKAATGAAKAATDAAKKAAPAK